MGSTSRSGELRWACCMAQAETKRSGWVPRVQGQVLKCPNKIISALSYIWSLMYRLARLKAQECVGDCGNSWSLLFQPPGVWGCQCSEGEAPSVATLEKVQPEHHCEISSPERLLRFGCPLLMGTCMNQIYGMTDKLYLTAHAQKVLWWHLTAGTNGIEEEVFSVSSLIELFLFQCHTDHWSILNWAEMHQQKAPSPSWGCSSVSSVLGVPSEGICAAGDRAVSGGGAAPLQ